MVMCSPFGVFILGLASASPFGNTLVYVALRGPGHCPSWNSWDQVLLLSPSVHPGAGMKQGLCWMKVTPGTSVSDTAT